MSADWTALPTPLGELLLTDHGRGLSGIWYPDHRRGRRPDLPRERRCEDGRLVAAAEQLSALLAGTRHELDVPLDPRGTPFQLAVWQQLRRIPRGTTVTYAELASRVDRPSAVRAVANAVGANPLSIAIPCHRVIGTSGRLAGYAGGVERKAWLLRHEGAHP